MFKWEIRSPEALAFYHAEALRGGWSVRQLERQLNSRFYERTMAVAGAQPVRTGRSSAGALGGTYNAGSTEPVMVSR